MDLSHPLAVVTPTLDGDVLRVLAGATAEFTPGQVHRLLPEFSAAGIAKVLARLTAQGIVRRRRAGAAYLYQLNRAHLAAPYIVALANQREELLERLGRAVASWARPPVFGALFGSAARDDHTTASDLDIFLVRPRKADPEAWDQHTAVLAGLASDWTGNDARILEYGEAEVRMTGRNVPVLAAIAEHGLVFTGDSGWLRSSLRQAGR